ncbi:TetR/AcrR family transcriptional regulator [Alkalihalobacillus pseudalcaliphilus]|uniref:TetR/AcrR family transcriptional regulator n=1 Tax=Alkalihalobacillus pseudalcaliphilus TaxID=79884 RepID=UPI00064DD6B0|nr:TetR/AcrR family transcriptional regulator [Alkalihalobacillus pseudalcaliphilus]KMK77564.1 transcriptional regulator [Alkalihalobacillus pseudalcaliphilus]
MKKRTRLEELERTRTRILDVAENLFMEKGFRAVSTREIAQHAKVTQPTLYHHFKDKETLYMVMIERFVESIQMKMQKVNEGEVADKLERMLMILSEEHPSSIMLMVHDLMVEVSEPNKSRIYILWRQTYLDPFMTIFRELKKEGRLRTHISPEEAARFCLLTLGQAMLWKNRRKELQAQFNIYVDIILNGTYIR